MPSNPTLPEDVNFEAYRKLEALGIQHAQIRQGIIDAIAPLITEWARKDQAEKDGALAREWLSQMHRDSPSKAFPDALVAAIRAQFPTPETTGGE